MTGGQQVELAPRFLGEPGYRHFTLRFVARGEPRGHVVYVPPFGEEMNRCRALVAQQARQLAAQGFHCTVVDFYGTGESDGELSEASLQRWYDNIHTTVLAIGRDSSLPLTLLGLRLGALLSLTYCQQYDVELEQVVLWQPVTSGKRYISQLLRQRVAALVNTGQSAETTADIRSRLQQGETVEISGYIVAEELVAGIEGISVAGITGRVAQRVFWMENVEDENDGLSAAASKAVDSLRASGNEVQTSLFTGPPIWQLHKREEMPDLLAQTTELVGRSTASESVAQ